MVITKKNEQKIMFIVSKYQNGWTDSLILQKIKNIISEQIIYERKKLKKALRGDRVK